jgi:hypothetical protein
MTEMDLLSQWCASVPPQREASRADARGRLLAAAAGTLHETAPRHPRLPVRLVMAASLVTVTAVAAALAGGLATTGHGPLSQPASAAELLRRAAAAPAPAAPRPDQFIYVKSTGVELIYPPPQARPAPGHPVRGSARGSRLVRFTIQTWTSVDGTRDGLVRERPCEVYFLPVHNRPAPGSRYAACEYIVGWGSAPGQAGPAPNPPGSYGWYASLPTSRAGLTQYLEGLKADPGTPAGQRIWSGIYGLFAGGSLLPARLRTAIYQLAASLPGVTLIPGVTDAAGRTGDAVALDGSGIRQELIFQPQTYQLLGIQEIILTPATKAGCASQNPPAGKCDGTMPIPAGAVAGSEAYLQVSVASSTPPLPANGAAPLNS